MALSTNLSAYWKLDSGALTTDSVASYTLTNYNSVAEGTAKLGTASADFGSANTTKYMERADACGVTGASESVSMWVKLNAEITTGTWTFMLHCPNANNAIYLNYEYNGGTRRLWATNWSSGIAFYETTRTNLTMGTSNWYHFTVTREVGTSGFKLYVNSVLFATGNGATGSSGGLNARMTLGVFHNAFDNTFTNYSSCLIDEVGLWSKVLTQDEIRQIYNNGKGNAYPLTDTPSLYGTVGVWAFNESSGDASDSTGNGYTLTNLNTATYTTGKLSNCTDLGASNTNKGFRITSAFGVTSATEAFTYCGWYMVDTSPTSGQNQIFMNRMMGSSFGTTGAQIRLYYANVSGTIKIVSQNDFGAGGAINYTTTLTTGTWYHLAVTFDGTNTSASATLYLNGSSVGTSNFYGTGNYSAYSDEMTIGINRTGSGDPLKGKADECLFYRGRALSSTEITALYNSGAGFAYPFTPSTAASFDAMQLGHFA